MTFEKLENIMLKSLQDPKKKELLPYPLNTYEYKLMWPSNVRILIKHFALHILQEFQLDEYNKLIKKESKDDTN